MRGRGMEQLFLFLARLVELELIDRERRMVERRIKAAKFPVAKSLDSFDFKAIPALNKAQVLELARGEWIERRENVIALGPSGTGKTHVASGARAGRLPKGPLYGLHHGRRARARVDGSPRRAPPPAAPRSRWSPANC